MKMTGTSESFSHRLNLPHVVKVPTWRNINNVYISALVNNIQTLHAVFLKSLSTYRTPGAIENLKFIDTLLIQVRMEYRPGSSSLYCYVPK